MAEWLGSSLPSHSPCHCCDLYRGNLLVWQTAFQDTSIYSIHRSLFSWSCVYGSCSSLLSVPVCGLSIHHLLWKYQGDGYSLAPWSWPLPDSFHQAQKAASKEGITLWLSLEEQIVQCLITEDLSHITDGTVAKWCEELQFKSWCNWFWEIKNTPTRDKRSRPVLALCLLTQNRRNELSVKSWSKAFLYCRVVWRACLCFRSCLSSRRSSCSSQNSRTQWGDSNWLEKSYIGY